jgi:hypothetical protein
LTATKDDEVLWQFLEILIHPDLKLTWKSESLNDKYITSTNTYADLAIGIVAPKIEFSTSISPVCFQPMNKFHDDIEAEFIGWNKNDKNVENLFEIVNVNDAEEFFHMPHGKNGVEFFAGKFFTGLC